MTVSLICVVMLCLSLCAYSQTPIANRQRNMDFREYKLTLCELRKIHHTTIIFKHFFFFFRKLALTFHTTLKYQSLFLGKIKISLSSFEFAQKEVKINCFSCKQLSIIGDIFSNCRFAFFHRTTALLRCFQKPISL